MQEEMRCPPEVLAGSPQGQIGPAQLAHHNWAIVFLGKGCHQMGRKAKDSGSDKGRLTTGWKGKTEAGKGISLQTPIFMCVPRLEEYTWQCLLY